MVSCDSSKKGRSKKGKKFELSHIFSLFKELKNADAVAEELEISKSNLSYYTKMLKELKILKMTGKGVWETYGDLSIVQKSVGTHSPLLTDFIKQNPKKQIRGHAFIWKIQFGREFDWKTLLDNSSLKKKYKQQSNGKVLRIMLNGRKIWLQRKGAVTVFEPFDYFGVNAYQSKGLAIWNLNLLLKTLLTKLHQQMCFYKFTTSRVHYALIKNELARQLNDRGEKLSIKTEDGTEWLWIDFSKGDGEFEVGNLKEGEVEKTSVDSQTWWNDMKKTQFSVTPSFLMEQLNETKNNFNEIGKMIKEGSEKQFDSELRIKQIDNVLRGHEEIMMKIVQKLNNS